MCVRPQKMHYSWLDKRRGVCFCYCKDCRTDCIALNRCKQSRGALAVVIQSLEKSLGKRTSNQFPICRLNLHKKKNNSNT